MNLQMDYGQRRLINVVGKITGAVAPDEWIIVGSHRDAWTFGASDSVSGHVSMMAVARAMSEMMKKGWKPRRSVLFISWDGEEQGLLGSTELVEDLTAELKAKAAVYVNRDAGAGGLNFCEQRGPLADAVRPRAGAVDSADGRDQDAVRRLARALARAVTPTARKAPPVGALGSGSDYTAFLDHVGIASMDMGLNGRGGDGSYHSTYDNPTWFKKYIDPQFTFSVLAAQITGVALLRLADAEVLPFDYESYGRQILEYIGEIEQQAIKASADGAKKIDFAGLRAAAEAFAKAGADVRARGESMLAAAARRPRRLAAINHRLIMAERDLIEPAGLPDRPWYRHVIYAPGLYTGYGVKTIPGVREAVDAGNYTRAAEQAQIVIRALQRATRTLQWHMRSTGRAPASRSCGSASGSSFIFEGIGKIRWFTDRRRWRDSSPAGRRRCRPDRGATCIWSASRCRTRRIFARAGPARRDHVRRGAGRRLLDAVLRVRRLLHGAELPVRQRRAVQVQRPDQRLRVAGARRYAGAGVGRRAAAVEHCAAAAPPRAMKAKSS